MNKFKNHKQLKKNTLFRITIRISIEKCSVPLGKLHVSKEIQIFHTIKIDENRFLKFWKKVRKKRPGVHSKNNHSNSKGSKNYVKKYRGQGR